MLANVIRNAQCQLSWTPDKLRGCCAGWWRQTVSRVNQNFLVRCQIRTTNYSSLRE